MSRVGAEVSTDHMSMAQIWHVTYSFYAAYLYQTSNSLKYWLGFVTGIKLNGSNGVFIIIVLQDR